MASRPNSPSTALRSPPLPEAPKESAISRLLIAPLTFLSFLLSLALIDSHNHSLRNTSPPPSRIHSFFHALIFKPASPYAYIKSPNGQGNEKEREKEPWHWHTKQRKMMKAEMDDAFRIRGYVMVVLAVLGTVGVLGVGVL
ncbi:hypothetical protein LSUE1_G009504, partial [Lachnellula suecica]